MPEIFSSFLGEGGAKLPKPRPLHESEQALPYPVGALPPLIRNALTEVASFVQAPPAMIAASALSAVSTAIQTRFGVERNEALRGPATLYLLTVAESGERKSTVDRLFTQAIQEWEAAQRQKYKRAMIEYKAALSAWEKMSGDPDDPDHMLSKPEEPRRVRILRVDDTPEALATALAEYPIASVISAEAGTIFGSHSMKPDVVMSNLAQANVMWDGGVIHRDRVSTGETRVEGMRVTMGLQVQPSVLSTFVSKTGGLAKGIGYFARFLFCQPGSTQGTRYYVDPPKNSPARSAFGDRIAALLELPAEFDEFDRLKSKFVTFDDLARNAWIAFHDEVEEKQGDEQEFAGIRDVASKAADNAARLACCFHIFGGDENASSRPIGLETMISACRLMRWYLDEAVRFARVADLAPEVGDAQLLEEWLVRETKKRCGQDAIPVISVNEVRRKGPNKLRQARNRRLDSALELLADHHRIILTSRIGRKGTDITLRVEVLKEYL